MAEKSPAFRFYPKDFLADSRVVAMDMGAVGMYTLLLCHAWNDGSIPAEPEAIARLLAIPMKQFTPLWRQVSICWVASDDGRLVQKRMEIERAKQLENRQRAAENGRNGGRPPKSKDTVITDEKITQPFVEIRSASFPKQKLAGTRFSLSLSLSLTEYLASLDTEREENSGTPSRAFGFAQWFISRGIVAEAIPADRGLDLVATAARENLTDAEALLASYEFAEIERRARHFFDAKKSGKIRRPATIASFRDAWDWAIVVDGEPSVPAALVPAVQDLEAEHARNIARLQARIARNAAVKA